MDHPMDESESFPCIFPPLGTWGHQDDQEFWYKPINPEVNLKRLETPELDDVFSCFLYINCCFSCSHCSKT